MNHLNIGAKAVVSCPTASLSSSHQITRSSYLAPKICPKGNTREPMAWFAAAVRDCCSVPQNLNSRGQTVTQYFTLRFLCGWQSGRGGLLGPGFDGRPVVTCSLGWTFLHQPWRTQVVHRSTLVLKRGGREVWREGGTQKDYISTGVMGCECTSTALLQWCGRNTVREWPWAQRAQNVTLGQRGGEEEEKSIDPDTRPEARGRQLQRLRIGFSLPPWQACIWLTTSNFICV